MYLWRYLSLLVSVCSSYVSQARRTADGFTILKIDTALSNTTRTTPCGRNFHISSSSILLSFVSEICAVFSNRVLTSNFEKHSREWQQHFDCPRMQNHPHDHSYHQTQCLWCPYCLFQALVFYTVLTFLRLFSCIFF